MEEVEGGGGVDDVVGDAGDVEVAFGGDGDDRVARQTVGKFSSIMAMKPCFISPAAQPSA